MRDAETLADVSLEQGLNDPKAIRLYTVFAGSEVIRLTATPRDPVVKPLEEMNKNAIKGIEAARTLEASAKKGNAEGVLAYLKKAGCWAFYVATKLGVSVAAKAIEESMKQH